METSEHSLRFFILFQNLFGIFPGENMFYCVLVHMFDTKTQIWFYMMVVYHQFCFVILCSINWFFYFGFCFVIQYNCSVDWTSEFALICFQIHLCILVENILSTSLIDNRLTKLKIGVFYENETMTHAQSTSNFFWLDS